MLNSSFDTERDERRGDRVAADEKLAGVVETAVSEQSALREALRKERKAREGEKEESASALKQLAADVDTKTDAIVSLQEQLEYVREELESKAQRVQSEMSLTELASREEKQALQTQLALEKQLRLEEMETLNEKLSAAKVAAGASESKLQAALDAEKKARAAELTVFEKKTVAAKKEYSLQITKLEKSITVEQTTKRKEIEKLAKSKNATEDSLKKFNEDAARLEALLAAEKELRRAEQTQFDNDAIAAKSLADAAHAEINAALVAERASKKTDLDAAREAKEAQLAAHREQMRTLEQKLAGVTQKVKTEAHRANEAVAAALDAANADKTKLELTLQKAKDALKSQIVRSMATVTDLEGKHAAEREALELKIEEAVAQTKVKRSSRRTASKCERSSRNWPASRRK